MRSLWVHAALVGYLSKPLAYNRATTLRGRGGMSLISVSLGRQHYPPSGSGWT